MLIIWALLLFCWLVNQGPLKQTKWAALLIFFATVFVMGWRSVTYTGDNIAYACFYDLNSRLTLQASWQNVVEGNGKDPFFYFLGNVFSKCGFSYRGWFVFISAVFMGGFCYLMYKRSQDFFLSIFFLITLGYFYFAMTGLRQALALGFCYIAFEFLCQRKLLWFAVFVAIGGLFHSSGWVFFAMYPLSFISFGRKYIAVVLLAPVIAFLFPSLLGTIVSQIAWNDHLTGYAEVTQGLTISGYIIESAIFFFGIWCLERQANCDKNHLSPRNNNNNFSAAYDFSKETFLFYGMTAIGWGCAFRAFSVNINNFFRIAMYFSDYTPLLIPTLLNRLPKSERKFALTVIMLICFTKAFWGDHYSYFSMFESLP